MNSLTITLLLAASIGSAHAFVYENPYEFSATGDFDGDGREDIVIVDKSSGNYRVAHQLVPGQHTWASARSSGIEGVTGFALGRLVATSRDTLAFTAPDANRVNLLEANSPNAAGLPLNVFTPTIGPNLAVALDAGGAGNTPLDDLFVASTYNNTPSPNQLGLLRNNAATFTPLGPSLVVPESLAAGNVVKVKTGVAPMAGVILRGQAGDTFRAYNMSAGTLIAMELGSLPTNANYVHANFSGTAFAQFLFFQPGDTNGALRLRTVIEPVPGSLTFGSETIFNLADPLYQVFTLPQPTGAKLLVLFGTAGASTARVYDFDGVNAPVLVEEFAAAPGEHFTGASPLPNGSFTLFSAPAGTNHSMHFHTFNFDGSQYVAGQSGDLPALTVFSGAANVFQFQHEPFVKSDPNLLRTVNAGDWSSQFNAQSLPQLTVTAESFVSNSNGLDNPTPVAVGPAHPQTQFGLVNQYAAPLSLFSLARPIGDEVVDVKIAPPPGTFNTSIQVTMTAPVGAQIYYRASGNANWTLYAGPITLFTNATVSYYGKPAAGNSKSVIHHASYHFTKPPGELDSDGDGVPDYVEIAKGLNPKGGPDSDKDGYSDLEELIQGTDPNNKNDAPTNQPRLEFKASLDFIETPRPLDGTLNAFTLSAEGTALRAYDLPGALLHYGTTANLNIPGVVNPAAKLSNIVINTRQRLLAIATEQHFDIATAGTNQNIGRELLALRAVPEVTTELNVLYNYGGGDLPAEANNWIAAAQAAQAAIAHETFIEDLGIYDTLAALLVEKKVADILLARGNAVGSNLTLFPFRPADNTRANLSQSALLAIESLGPNGESAFKLRDIHYAASNSVSPSTPFNAPLRALTEEIYRISSASNEVVALPSPVDTLRKFLNTGVLHSNYVASSTLTPADLAGAYSAGHQLLAAMGSRPTTNLTLVVRFDTFTSDCVPLDPLVGVGPWNLFLPNGDPFRLLESFNLPQGSKIYVLGFTDISSHGCPGLPLEVIALSLESVPAVSSTDADGDLLPDDLELLLFGNLNQTGNGDADGDGMSNLQESLDGTDPKDGLSKPPMVVDLTPPQINIQSTSNGQLLLSWSFPEPYASKMNFILLTTDLLGQGFNSIPAPIQNLSGGNFQVVLPNEGNPAKFYHFQLALK